jgi:hypothetical protein
MYHDGGVEEADQEGFGNLAGVCVDHTLSPRGDGHLAADPEHTSKALRVQGHSSNRQDRWPGGGEVRPPTSNNPHDDEEKEVQDEPERGRVSTALQKAKAHVTESVSMCCRQQGGTPLPASWQLLWETTVMAAQWSCLSRGTCSKRPNETAMEDTRHDTTRHDTTERLV